MKNTLIATSAGSIVFIVLHFLDYQQHLIEYIPTLISALTLWLATIAYFNWKNQKERELIHNIELKNQHLLFRIDALFESFRLEFAKRIKAVSLGGGLQCRIKRPRGNILRDTEELHKIRELCEEISTNCWRVENIDSKRDLSDFSSALDNILFIIELAGDLIDTFLGDQILIRKHHSVELDSIYVLPELLESLQDEVQKAYSKSGIRNKTIKKLNLSQIEIETDSEIMKIINELKELQPPETK